VDLAISEDVAHAHYWVASLRSLLNALVKGLFNGRDVFVRDISALGGVLELARQVSLLHLSGRLYVSNDTGVLTRSSTLLLVQEVEVGFGVDGLAVVDCRISNDEVDVVLTLHAFTVHKQVQLTHATNNDLLRL